jgi:hypothetical protein
LELLSASSPWSAHISVDLSGVKKFRLGTSDLNCSWGLLIPVVVVVGFFALLSASSVGFHLHHCYQNSSKDSYAIIVVLALLLSLLNRASILMNVLKALAAFISVCSYNIIVK